MNELMNNSTLELAKQELTDKMKRILNQHLVEGIECFSEYSNASDAADGIFCELCAAVHNHFPSLQEANS